MLGVAYSVATPPFESGDELFHYHYVKYIADGRGLPVQPPGESYAWRQEGSQPPLYYALAAATTFWIDTGRPEDVWQRNPHGKMGLPHAPNNKNMVVHSDAEAFPYTGVYLALHLGRLLSVALGAIAVLLVYLIALEVWPSVWFGLGAVSLAAFTPTFVFTAAAVNNDVLVIALSSAVLLLLLRALKRPPSSVAVVGLGLLLGLAALAKLSGLGLWPLTALTLVWAGWRHGEIGRSLRQLVVIAGIGVAVAGWWYGRNWALYGDPTGLNAMLAVAGVRQPAATLEALAGEMWGVFVTYWAQFGGANIIAADAYYQAMRLLAIAAVVGLAVACWRADIRRRVHWPSLALLGLWLALLFVGLLRWTQLTPASFGRLLFPAIAAVSAGLFLGLASLLPSRALPWLSGVVAVAGFGFAAIVPFAYIAPAYPTCRVADAAVVAKLSPSPNFIFGDAIELVGATVLPLEGRPGDSLTVDLYLRGRRPMAENYSLFIHLFDGAGNALGQTDSYPGGGGCATSQWTSGRVYHDLYVVPVAADARAPSALLVEVGFYRWPDVEGLSAKDAAGRTTTPYIARLRLAPSAPIVYDIETAADVVFGRQEVARGDSARPTLATERLRLVGYAAPSRAEPGQSLPVRLYWHADRDLGDDYTVFVHLIGPAASDRRWAQDDRQPHGGAYPTSLWALDEVVEDAHELRLPDDMPSGRYRLLVGSYRQPSLEHLLTADGDKAAIIAEIEVAR